MVTRKQKQATGAAAALLLLGSAYAWQSANQHKTNEFRDTFKDNDVTLVEDFVPITDWLQGQDVNKDISVKNNTTAETGNNAYVRIQLKEFLEFTNRTETLSTVRYAVNPAGDFAKFDTQEAAQAYADANKLTGAPVQIAQTAFEGADKYFIPTNADATNGQYGKFLVLSVGDGTPESIIDPSVTKATGIDHQALTHAEDSYTTQLFDSGDDKLRTYPSLAKDTPTGGGIDASKDLTDYISWTFGPALTTLADFDADIALTAQWVVDPATGWVYWSQALAPGQTTGKFLDSLTLSLAPKNVSLYYAIHTDLEAVDFNDIDTMAPPTEIETAWKSQKFTVTFNSNGGSAVDPLSVSRDRLITKPANPTMADYDFVGWYTKADLTGNAWHFDTDKMPATNLTLYAKWEAVPIARVHFRNYDDTADVLPDVNITAANPDLTIPDAPKADHYFLGWATSPSAPITEKLVLPEDEDYQDVRTILNPLDRTRLKREVAPKSDIGDIVDEITLYAVYYKKKEAVTGVGDEFIWANALWRTLDLDMDDNADNGMQALVLKISLLTELEATGDGSDSTTYMSKFVERGASSADPTFSAEGVNGYEQDDNSLRKINEQYFENLSDEEKEAVNAVNLDNPTFERFKNDPVVPVFTGGSGTYNTWEWNNGTKRYYKDHRFKTTLDNENGEKTAFALSYGDIHEHMAISDDSTVSTWLNVTTVPDNYWLRSPGSNYNTIGIVTYAGNFAGSGNIKFKQHVRPALSLTIN